MTQNSSFFERMQRHRATSIIFGISFFLVLAGWLRAHLALRRMEQPAILHWTSESGISQIVLPGDIASTLAGIGVTGALFVLVNFLLALELQSRDKVWSGIMTFAAAAVSVLIFIAFTAIVAVN